MQNYYARWCCEGRKEMADIAYGHCQRYFSRPCEQCPNCRGIIQYLLLWTRLLVETVSAERFRSLKSSAELLRLQVNGVLWDMTRPFEEDCKLSIYSFDTDKGRDTFWHSSAHILGQVWEWLWNIGWCFLHNYFVSLYCFNLIFTLGVFEVSLSW